MAEFPQAIIDKQGYLDPHISIVNGNLRLNESVWDDLRIPVNAIRVPTSNYPDWYGYKGGQVLAFGDQAVEGNEEYINFNVQLPHNWKEGTNIEPHVHWVVESAVEADVVWQLTHSWANIGGTFPSETTINLIDSSGGGSNYHVYSDFSAINGSGKTLSSMLICSLCRHSSDAGDTLTSVDALLLEIDFHYQIDRFGSKYEASN